MDSPPGAILDRAAAMPSSPERGVLERNLAALRVRGVELPLDDIRPAEASPRDHATARETVSRAIPASRTAAEASKPIVIEGFASPSLLIEAWRATPPTPDGYSPRLIIVEPDTRRALNALASQDVSDALADPRVECFFGPRAIDRLGQWLRAEPQQTTALPALVLRPSGSVRTVDVETTLCEAHEAQGRLHERLRDRVAGHYAGKHRAYWSRRFSDGKPVRVLLPISRFSTFVRRSAEDLAEALRALGHEALVLIEPDAHSKLTTPAYLAAFDSFRPDLVVLINYTRRHMGHAVPAGIPFACWVQDRMAHLFDPAAGASQGELDFLVGHLHPDLFSHFGYPRSNRLFAFVPASTRRFHDGPVSESLRRKHACELAYVSHQSETPEGFHARVAPMFASNDAVRRALAPLRDAAVQWMDAADADPSGARPDRQRMVNAALTSTGLAAPDPRLVLTVFGNYLVPFMERLHRHRTLEWAARICERRGWTFRLYGRGWERHATLARWAVAQPLGDTDDLRAAYQSARAHLHVSLNTNSHQRVYEGALSGGLVLRRGPSPDWELAKIGMMRRAAMQPPSNPLSDGSTIHEFRAADGADPLAYFAMRGIGPVRDAEGRPVYRRTLTPAVRRDLLDFWPDVPLDTIPDLAFPNARETLFSTEAELEQQLARAIEDAEWRRSTIESHRGVALRSCTYEQLAPALLQTVRAGLASEASR